MRGPLVRFALAACLFLAPAAPALALDKALLAGVSFALPEGLRPAGAAAAALAWVTEDQAIRVVAVARRVEAGGAEAELKTYAGWPTFGAGLAHGLGEAFAKEMQVRPGAQCTFRGTPVARDSRRWLFRVQAEVACSTPTPARVRISAMLARTKANSVTVLVMDRGAEWGLANRLASAIWASMAVTESDQLPPGPAPADPSSEPFAGCRVVSQTADTWTAECFNSRMTVMDLSNGRGDDAFVNAILDGYQSSAAPPVERRTESFLLTDGPAHGTRLIATPRAEESAQLLLAAVTRPEGRRILSCNAYRSGEELCAEMLRGASSGAWRAGPPGAMPRADRVPTIAGRSYQAPPGCEVTVEAPGFGLARCEDDALLMWGEVSPEDPGFRTAAGDFVRKFGFGAGSRAECSIDDVAAACTRHHGAEDQGEIYVAEARVRDRVVLVLCASTRKSGGGVPAVCAPVLSVRPSEPAGPRGPTAAPAEHPAVPVPSTLTPRR